MSCPVCGLPDAVDPCARCGTDLAALEGTASRLEIKRLGADRSARAAGPPLP